MRPKLSSERGFGLNVALEALTEVLRCHALQRQERVCEPLSAAHASGQAVMSEHLPGVDVIFRDDT